MSDRGLVQLVEHQSPKLGVGGSSPPAPAIYMKPWCTAHVSPVQTSRKIGVQFPRGFAKALTVACQYCLVDTPDNEYVTAARRKLCELGVGATTM